LRSSCVPIRITRFSYCTLTVRARAHVTTKKNINPSWASKAAAPRRPPEFLFYVSFIIKGDSFVHLFAISIIVLANYVLYQSPQEAITKIQELSKISILEPPSFQASMPLILQVPAARCLVGIREVKTTYMSTR